ncbi:MAG TPA: VanZ family protein [Gemmatimonadales bacterium]
MPWRPRLVQAAAILLIVTATIVPAAEPGRGSPLCLLCGDEATSGFLLNIALFVPLGLVLAWSGWSVKRTALTGGVLSVLVETAQWFIPGRHSALDDVVANTIGAMVGAALWIALPRLLDPDALVRRRLLVVATIVAVLAQIATAILIVPDLPRSTWYGQWAAHFRGFEIYEGSILAVTLGSEPLHDGELRDSGAARDGLLSGFRLDVAAIAGRSPQRPAPIFSIADREYRTIIQILADRSDVLLRFMTRAERAGFTPAELRFRNATRDVREGDTISLTLTHPGRWCVRLRDAADCRGFTVGSSWRFVAPTVAPDSALLDAAWLAILFVPVGYWGSRRTRPLALAVGVLPMFILPIAAPGMMMSALTFAGAAAGMLGGVLAGVAYARHSLRRGTGHA